MRAHSREIPPRPISCVRAAGTRSPVVTPARRSEAGVPVGYRTVTVMQPDRVLPFTFDEVFRVQNRSLPLKPGAGV